MDGRPGTLSAARLRADVETIAAAPRHRRADPLALDAAREHVGRELARAGWQVRRVPVACRAAIGVSDTTARGGRWRVRLHRGISGANLVATRPGSSGPWVVVGAHLDTVQGSPGARGGRLHRGAPARARARAAGRAAAMICLESVGFFAHSPRSQAAPRGLGRLLGAELTALDARSRPGDFVAVVERRSSAALAARIRAAAAAQGLPTVRVRDPRPDGLAGVLSTALAPPLAAPDRSDHFPFWRRGVPAVLLTDTADLRNSGYHTARDVPESLDTAAMAQLARALADVLADPAAASERH